MAREAEKGSVPGRMLLLAWTSIERRAETPLAHLEPELRAGSVSAGTLLEAHDWVHQPDGSAGQWSVSLLWP